MGFFDALSRGLERSREALNEVFYFGGEVDEDFWEDLEDTLVMGDMGAEVAIKVSDDLRDAAAKKNLKTAPQLRRALAEQLEQHFVPIERDPFADTPSCVLFVGINGAGKTTVFNLLTKVYQPTHGTILLDGEDTSGKSVYQVNRMGIARTFQNIRLFNTMTVEDNVKVGLHNQERYSGFEGVLRLPTYWKHEKAAHERAMELLSIFDMEHLANEQAGSLPYGAQRRLEIVRALATNPKLLLLDEPAAGMNPSETAELMENIVKIRDTFGIAIMLIEHDMSLVMNICEGICVLNFGKVIAKGTAEEIQNNDAVIEAYLGKQDKGEN